MKVGNRILGATSKLIFYTVILAVGLLASLGYALAAWSPPAQNPPGGNTANPLDVSHFGQTKIGGLTINNGGVDVDGINYAPAKDALIVNGGSVAGQEGHVTIKNLTSCGKVYTDANGLLTCGSENQTLGTSGNNITISGGNSVTAPYADNAGHAGTADYATNAGYANNAGHAGTADSATTATTATNLAGGAAGQIPFQTAANTTAFSANLIWDNAANSINPTNLKLPVTTATAGIIKSGNDNFIHAFGTRNFFAGVNAGNLSMTGTDNTGVGYNALLNNSQGIGNTAFGSEALKSTQATNNSNGLGNSAFGYWSMQSNTTGWSNSALGEASLRSNTSGDTNTSVGDSSLYSNTTGSNNSALGFWALGSNTSGVGNVSVGYASLASNSVGNHNTALGWKAGNHESNPGAVQNTYGSDNTFIGYNSGYGLTGAGYSPGQLTNATAIGANAVVVQSNSLILGASGTRIGIGTSEPATALQVIGTVTASKITADLYDPIYSINGIKYATYLSGMTGVKEETTGTAVLTKDGDAYKYVFDFGGATEGSDLWLFGKVVNIKNNFDKLAVILTPSFDGRVWYEKEVVNNRLTIYAVPSSGYSPVASGYEVSYRLTAPRFDAGEWSNYSHDLGVDGLIINN